MAGYVAILLAGALLGWGIVVGNREAMGARSSWKSLADRFALDFRAGDFGVSGGVEGDYEGRRVSISLASLATRRGRRIHTRLTCLTKNPAGLALTVTHKMGYVGGSDLARLLGLAEVGDPRVAELFEVRASDGTHARGLLDPKISERLVWEERIGLELDGHMVSIDAKDAVDDVERLRLLLDLAVLVAKKAESL